MLTKEEASELIEKSREDGLKLHDVANYIYNISMIANFIIGIGGFVLFIATLDTNKSLAFLILLGTAIGCFTYYITTIIITHLLKVLVHLLFSNIALLAGVEK